MVHKGLLLLSIKPEGIRFRCEQACRRYRKQQTRRMAFLPDTSPYWNVVDREKCYPLQKLEFEGRMLNFPANLERCSEACTAITWFCRLWKSGKPIILTGFSFLRRPANEITETLLIGSNENIEQRNMIWNMIGSFL